MNGTPIPQRLPFSRNSFYIFPRNVNSFLCRIWYHSIGCILENSVLYSICTCRHLANHLVSQNLIFFNNYHKPFPSRAMSNFILLHMRILIVLSIFSNTWVYMRGQILLSALSLVWVQQMEFWSSMRAAEHIVQRRWDKLKRKGDHQMDS